MTAPAPLTRLTAPRALAALALGLAWALFFFGQLFHDVVPYLRDDVLTYLPLRQYLHERLRAGEFPQWYPYEALGVPLPGQLAVGLFHPATYLLLWLDYARAVKWNLLLALLLALAGAYRWARAMEASRPAAVTAAFAFGFGGYALGTSSTLPYTMSLAALPWVGWALRGLARTARADYAAWLALCLALVVLAGDPQSFGLSFLLAPMLLSGVRAGRDLGRLGLLFGLAVALALALSAADLLPGRVLFAESVRLKGHATPDLDTFWALPPLRLLELVTPGFLPDAVQEPALATVLRAGPGVFCTTVFAGAVTLALAALGARRRWGFALLALLGVWLALGEAGGLLPVLQRLVPPLGRMRYPEKYLALTWLALVPVVAAGADRVLRERGRFRLRLGVAALALLVLAWLAPGLVDWRGGGALVEPLGGAWRGGLFTSAAFLFGLALFVEAPRRLLALALPALVFFELFEGNRAHLPMAPRALLDAPPAVVAALNAARPPNGPPVRVLSQVPYPRDTATNPDPEGAARAMLAALYPDTSGLFGLSSLGPRLGGFSLRYARFLGGANAEAAHYGPWVGACWQVEAGATPFETRAVPLPCRGAAYLAGAVAASRPGEVLGWLRSHPAGGDSVAWEGGPGLAAPAGGTVRWVRWAPEVLELWVETPAPAALVVADELTPGWSATVDGAAVAIHPTLLALRGVEVPQGRHAVRFEYHTPRLKLGLAVMALAFAGCLGLLAFGLVRRRTARAR